MTEQGKLFTPVYELQGLEGISFDLIAVEKNTLDGFVLDAEKHPFALTYKDQNTELVSTSIRVENQRQKAMSCQQTSLSQYSMAKRQGSK